MKWVGLIFTYIKVFVFRGGGIHKHNEWMNGYMARHGDGCWQEPEELVSLEYISAENVVIWNGLTLKKTW